MCEGLKKQVTETPVEKPARLQGTHQINGDTPPHDDELCVSNLLPQHVKSARADDSPPCPPARCFHQTSPASQNYTLGFYERAIG